MWYFLIFLLAVSSCIDSISSAAHSSHHKRDGDIDDPSNPWTKPYLPNTIEPISYDLYITPRYPGNGTVFDGNVTIEVNVLNLTKCFIVHSKKSMTLNALIYNLTGEEISREDNFDYAKNDYHVLNTRNFVQGRVKIVYWFRGNMTLIAGSKVRRSEMFGMYNIPLVNEDRTGGYLIMTDFRPNYARNVFPNFDEPRFKATYRISISHYNTETALSNMPMETYAETEHQWHFTVFKVSPKMSSHQVFFVITDYRFKNKTVDGKQLFAWARSGPLERADYCLDMIPTIQNYLQQELEMPNSLEKLDQLAIPGDALTARLDHMGLVTYPESTLLYNSTTDGDSARFEAQQLIVRAQTRYYFGNLVSCRYWDHVWVDDGLAIFYEIKTLMEIDPNSLYKEYFYGWKLEDAMYVDSAFSILALIRSFDASAITTKRDFNTHGEKGAAILRMVENIVGPDIFKNGIRQYLRQNANGTVVTDDLWTAIQQQITSGLEIKEIMTNWVGINGYPLITVELLPGNMINATQQLYEADTPNDTYKWYVPLTYRTKQGQQQLTWMNKTDVVFEIPELPSDDWIEFNIDRTGYYRVNYSEDLWSRLARQLNEDHTVFSTLSRSRLFSDAAALAKANYLGYDVFLNLTRYAWKETDLIPWGNIVNGLHELRKFVNTPIYNSFRNHLLNLTSNLMNKLQVDKSGSYIEIELRPRVAWLSCIAGHEGCIANSTRAFRAWIENDGTAAVTVVSCACIADALQESLWNATFEKYKRTQTTKEKDELLKALTCARNLTLLERLLDYYLDPTIVPGNKVHKIVHLVATNPLVGNFSWMWLKSKYAEIERTKGSGFLQWLVFGATSCLKTQEQYQDVLDFYNDHPSVSDDEKLFTNHEIENRIDWMDRNFNTVQSWFEQLNA